MHSNYHSDIFGYWVSVIRNRAVNVSGVGSCAPSPFVSFKSDCVCEISNYTSINRVNSLKTFEDSFSVVISSVLFTSTSDSIVVLNHSYHIEKGFFGLQ